MKENILYGIIGILVGLVGGFVAANSINQNAYRAAQTAATAMQNPNLPADHPAIPGTNPGASLGVGADQSAAMAEVQAALDKAKQEPNNFDAQVKVGELYYQIEQFDNAIEYLKRANQIKPDDYFTIVNLGNAYFDSDRYAEAEKWYLMALAQKSDDINVRTDLGLTFVFREPPDYERAVVEFNRSLETNPNHVQALQNLTVAYTKKGDAQNARATLAKLESVDPSNKALPKLREEVGKL